MNESSSSFFLESSSGRVHDFLVIVTGDIRGRHYAASLNGPEEWPEFEIDDVDIYIDCAGKIRMIKESKITCIDKSILKKAIDKAVDRAIENYEEDEDYE